MVVYLIIGFISMEIWKVLVVTVVVVIALCGLIYTIHLLNYEQKKRIYVYPKTKDKYLVKGIVKMKDLYLLNG